MTDKRLIDFYLQEIDDWRAGRKATPGSPVESDSYQRNMRETIKYLEARLDSLRRLKPKE